MERKRVRFIRRTTTVETCEGYVDMTDKKSAIQFVERVSGRLGWGIRSIKVKHDVEVLE